MSKTTTTIKILLINGDEYTFNANEFSFSFGEKQVVIYDKNKRRMTYIPWSAIIQATVETKEE
jgi:hypothetical protein